MTKIRVGMVISLVTFLVLTLVGTGMAEVVDRIVAIVNKDVITMSELQSMAKAIQAQAGVKSTSADAKKIQHEMLEALIDRKLANEEAKRRGIKVSPKEVDAEMARFRQRNNLPDDAALAKALSNEGLSLKEFRQQVANQMIQERLMAVVMATKVSVSDAAVRRLYDEKFKEGGNLFHVVSLRLPFPPEATQAQKDEIKQKAESILKATQRGESFRQAAAQFSLSLADVGFVAQEDLDPRLAQFLSKLKPDEVGPVETPVGYQLIQVVGHRTGEAPPFEKVAPQIRNILMQQEMAKHFGEWVKTLREKAHIRIML